MVCRPQPLIKQLRASRGVIFRTQMDDNTNTTFIPNGVRMRLISIYICKICIDSAEAGYKPV